MSKYFQALTRGVAAAVLAGAVASAASAQSELNQAERIQSQANSAARQTQETINQLDNTTNDLFAEYLGVAQRVETLELFVRQQEIYLESQSTEINGLRNQISQVDEIRTELLPMQRDMLECLRLVIDSDIPFYLDTRRERLRRLEELLGQHDVTPDEQYRKLMEAYEIELDYGRFVESWEAQLYGEPDGPLVDYVRYGRLAWVYVTKDGTEAKYWDQATSSWLDLDGSMIRDVQLARRIANEQASPDIYRAPVPAVIEGDKRDENDRISQLPGCSAAITSG